MRGFARVLLSGQTMAARKKPHKANSPKAGAKPAPPGKTRAPARGDTIASRRAAPVSRKAGPEKTAVDRFERFARFTSLAAGRPAAFCIALGVVLVWAVTGPIFHYSDTWQLVINTGTTIVTFLMVFLIQQSQNRDTMAVQIKLAELIIAAEGAHDVLATAEDLSEKELSTLHGDFCKKSDQSLLGLEKTHGKNAVSEAVRDADETKPAA
jgi:low affinity Fe/Cu permease